MEKKQKIFSFLFILYWLTLWFSINASLHEAHEGGVLYTFSLINFSENIIRSVNYSRIILPLIFTSLIITYFIFIIIFKKEKINKVYLFIILIFFSQIIGLYFNEERNFSTFNTYLPFFCIGTVCLFALNDQIQIKNTIKYFFLIEILILFLVFVTILSLKINELENLNFNSLFSERDNNIFNNNNPRITGLSRTLAMINLFLIVYIFSLKQFFFKLFLLILTSFFSILLLLMEARGTLLSYFIALFFIIIFLTKYEAIFKIKYFLLLIIFPIILFIFIFNSTENKNLPKDNNKIFNSRIISPNTSGRLDTWTYIFKNYEYKKIFGYGPQGDRFFLKNYPNKNNYGDNSSNILAYTMLSGGIVAVFIWCLVFFEIMKIFIKNKNNFFFNMKNFYLNFSITCIVFFSIRSLVENSFGLFGIDFLMIFLSIVYILNSSKILMK